MGKSDLGTFQSSPQGTRLGDHRGTKGGDPRRGAATGALVGVILGTYGYYTWLAEARGPALVYFVTAVIAFVGTTGTNWWMDRKQMGDSPEKPEGEPTE